MTGRAESGVPGARRGLFDQDSDDLDPSEFGRDDDFDRRHDRHDAGADGEAGVDDGDPSAEQPRPQRRGSSMSLRSKLWYGLIALVVFSAVVAAFVLLTSEKSGKSVSLTTAAKKTQGVKTLQFEIDRNLSDAAGTPIKGELDAAAKLTQLTLDGAEFAKLPLGSSITAIYDSANQVMYLGGDYVQSQLASGKSYVKIDINSIGGVAGFGAGQLGSALQSDPLSVLSFAVKGAKTTDVGKETILTNVSTEHFQLKVATADLLKAVQLDTSSALTDEQSSLPKTVNYDAWVDKDNFVRQVTVTIPVSSSSLTYSIRYTAIDPDVKLAAPTDAQSFDVGRLLGGG